MCIWISHYRSKRDMKRNRLVTNIRSNMFFTTLYCGKTRSRPRIHEWMTDAFPRVAAFWLLLFYSVFLKNKYFRISTLLKLYVRARVRTCIYNWIYIHVRVHYRKVARSRLYVCVRVCLYNLFIKYYNSNNHIRLIHIW